MQLRPLTPADLPALDEIDATVESSSYLHVDRQAPSPDPSPEPAEDAPAPPAPSVFDLTFTVQERPLRQRLIEPNRLSDELRFLAKQLATGGDEGLALVAEHEGQLVALLLAQPDALHRTYDLLDLRVDYDFRRQGVGLALLYELISQARTLELRAVRAETPTNNFPAISLFKKVAFELAGLDTHRRSNHDLVKEAVTLLWYAALD